MLTRQQQDSFEKNGFLVIHNVLDDKDLTPLERDYAALLDQRCEALHQQGLIHDNFAEHNFAERYARTLTAYPQCIDDFNISLPLINGPVDPDTYRAHFSEAVFGLQRNDKILDLVESLIGPEISSSPVQQMRIKPPQKALSDENVSHSNAGTTTWHQDTVAVLPEADNTEQITVWIAITDADEENGCLASIPGSHREGAHPHESGDIAREPTVPKSIIAGRQGVSLPIKRGGVILFHKQNIHCSRPNRSDRMRWSLDIRYHPTGQASGRPAFPGFIARSKADPDSELQDAKRWKQRWEEARERIIRGEYAGPIFRDWRE